MPAPRRPLPDTLPAAFALRDARAAGVEGRLRDSSLDVPFRGARCPAGDVSVATRVRALQALDPALVASHQTAALLLNLPLPRRLEEDPTLHLMSPTERGRCRQPGVVGHRGAEARQIIVVEGTRTTSWADTWCDLAPLLGVDQLVAVGDAAAQRLRTIEPLSRCLKARTGARGVLKLRRALEDVRVGAASPGETRARLALVRAGLPEPALNREIYDRAGGWIATGDLVWHEQRVVVEYQGKHHFGDGARAISDIERRRLLEAEGWTVIEMTKRDLSSPAALAAFVGLVAEALGVTR